MKHSTLAKAPIKGRSHNTKNLNMKNRSGARVTIGEIVSVTLPTTHEIVRTDSPEFNEYRSTELRRTRKLERDNRRKSQVIARRKMNYR